MKKKFTLYAALLTAILLSAAGNGWAQSLLLVDDFTGLTVANLAGQSSWIKGGTGPDATVATTTPLTYTGYNGGGGEYVVMPTPTSTTSRVYKGFTTTAVSTGSFYVSFLLKISAADATGIYFITLGDAAGGTSYNLKLFAKSSGVGYLLGLSRLSNTGSYGSSVLTFGQTYLIVMRYTGVTGATNDLAYLWINPSLSSEPSTSSAEVSYGTTDADPTSLGQFIWHNRSTANPTGSFDGVRVAYGSTSANAWTALAASSAGSLTPPTLAAAGSATVDAPFNVTFTDDATWRGAISAVKVGGTTLTAGYSVSAGQITFTPSASSPASLLQSAGTKTISVVATGYTDAAVSQTIGAGAANKLVMNVQPTAPASNGAALAVQPSVYIRDQYGNATTSTANVTAAVGAGTWTIGGTTTVAASGGTATFTNLTATSAAAVTGATISFTSGSLAGTTSGTFNIPAPPPPTLIAAASATVDAPFDVTFTDNPTWRAAITSITVGASTLSASAYAIAAGKITFTPSASTLLQSAGAKSIAVIATGYSNATVSQTIGAGAATKLGMKTQPTAPASNGAVLAVQPAVYIQDQYGNATTSTANVTAAVGAGTWTIGGTTTVTASGGTATFTNLTATSAAAVTGATISFTSGSLSGVTSGTFDIPAPAPANNLCSNATAITIGAAAINGTLVGATYSSPFTSKNDVWYSFTPSTTGTYNISVSGFTGDVDVAVFSNSNNCPTSTTPLWTSYSSNPTEVISQDFTTGVTYFVRVLAYDVTAESSTFTIGVFPPAPVAPTASNATNVTSTSFTANWGAVSGATSYRLDVYTLVSGSANLTEGFDGGSTAPTGWTFTGITGTYTTTTNYGTSSPSLKIDDTGDRILTPSLSGPATSMSFWIKGQASDATSALLVEGFNGTSWVTIQNITNSIPTTGTTYTYNAGSTPPLPSNLIQFRYTYIKSVGNVAFDDVAINYNSNIPSYVTGYNNLGVGNVTSYSVTGLNPSTTYYYVVRAVNSGGTSANSNEKTVTTLQPAPTITSFTPTSGCSNAVTSVVITGTNFTGATSVKLSGNSIGFTVDSPTKITANVPISSTTGKIEVTTPGGTVQSSGDFTVEQAPVAGTLAKTPVAAAVCEGTSVSAALTAGSGGNGTDELEYRYNGTGAWSAYTSSNPISTTGKTQVEVRTRRMASVCSASSYTTVSWTVEATPVAGTLAKSPSSSSVCDGTSVSAALTVGSGGNGTDELEYRYNGTGAWSTYNSGNTIGTTGKTQVEVRTRRTASVCSASSYTTVSWTVNSNVTPTFTQLGPYCAGATIPALPINSNNGISGNWSPAIDNTQTTVYTFTPSSGCATTTTMTITINATSLTWTGGAGSEDWQDPANWSPTQVPSECADVIIPYGPSKYPTLLSTTKVKSITINSGASFIDKGSLTATNGATVERFIEKAFDWSTGSLGGWHLISSPVTAQPFTTGGFTPGFGYDLYLWDEPTMNWLNYKDHSGSPSFSSISGSSFKVGRGYDVAYEYDVTLNFTGILNKDDVGPIAITKLGAAVSGASPGWNLLGNPFPSALDYTLGNWQQSNVNGVPQVYKESASSYKTLAEVGNIIPAMNGFMVEANSGGSITIPAAAKVHSPGTFFKSAKSSNDMIVLVANDLDSHTAQSSVVRFDPAATAAYDPEFDSHFLAGFAPMFYSMTGSEKCALNTLPACNNNLVIPFEFVKNDATRFSIELEKEIPFITVFLTDKKTGIETNLTEARSYSFTSAEGDSRSRFALHFLGTTGIQPAKENLGISAYLSGSTVHISQAVQQTGKVFLYNATGQLLSVKTMEASPAQQLSIPRLAPGVYVLTIRTDRGTYNQKVVVNQ